MKVLVCNKKGVVARNITDKMDLVSYILSKEEVTTFSPNPCEIKIYFESNSKGKLYDPHLSVTSHSDEIGDIYDLVRLYRELEKPLEAFIGEYPMAKMDSLMELEQVALTK